MKNPLDKMIEQAQRRENADDHLTDKERAKIVKLYRQQHAEETLPANMTEAYLEIIG